MLLELFNIIELTHLLSPAVPTWNGSCGFCLEIKKDYDKVFRVQQIKMHAGLGTHMDAPSHRFPGGMSIDEISLEKLIAPVCVVDVSKKADADYEISVEDIENYEGIYGKIASGSLVIGYTGWGHFWGDPKAYRNADTAGQMHFPAFSKKAAELLIKRGVVGLAIDTLSPDCLDKSFPVHQLILGEGKYIIENIANASLLPPQGGYAITLPLRAEGCSEAPVRMIGFIPKKRL